MGTQSMHRSLYKGRTRWNSWKILFKAQKKEGR